MKYLKQFTELIPQLSNRELIRLKHDFDFNYPNPMHKDDAEILQVIDDEIEMREVEGTLKPGYHEKSNITHNLN